MQYVFAWDTNNTAYGTDDSGGMYTRGATVAEARGNRKEFKEMEG